MAVARGGGDAGAGVQLLPRRRRRRSQVRFVFCKTEDVLAEAAARLRSIGRGSRAHPVEAAARSGLQR